MWRRSRLCRVAASTLVARQGARPPTSTTSQHNRRPAPASTPTVKNASFPSSPVPAPSLDSVVHAVEQLKGSSRRTQHLLRTHEDTLQLLQRKVTMMERQISHLDTTAEELRGKLQEVHRVVGEVVMGQRNTDLLMQQMEQRQQGSAGGKEMESRSQSSPSTGNTIYSTSTPAPATAAEQEVSHAPTKLPMSTSSSLEQQVAFLEARLHQLTVELFGADRILSAAPPSLNISSLAATVASTTDRLTKRQAVMAALHDRYGLSSYVGPDGVQRVVSQSLRLHSIPFNLGAAEVRELCVQHVCAGNAAGLVSCMLHRSSSSDSAENIIAAPKMSPNSDVTSTVDAAASAVAKVVENLPSGEAVEPVHPHTKSFTVVFADSAMAVRGLRVLNGLQLRQTRRSAAMTLAAEPVISADVLAALKETKRAE